MLVQAIAAAGRLTTANLRSRGLQPRNHAAGLPGTGRPGTRCSDTCIDARSEPIQRPEVRGALERRPLCYLGTNTKIIAHTDQDIDNCSQLMAELLDLLPALQVVILGGNAAEKMRERHARDTTGHLKVVEWPTTPWAEAPARRANYQPTASIFRKTSTPQRTVPSSQTSMAVG
jgi:hypothetical protein